jgi:hypothetical protein
MVVVYHLDNRLLLRKRQRWYNNAGLFAMNLDLVEDGPTR